MDAKAGMSTLCLHRISKRSSPSPSTTTDWSERMADKYDASYSVVQLTFSICKTTTIR